MSRGGLWIVLLWTIRMVEPVLGELALAEGAREEAALVRVALDVDEGGVREPGGVKIIGRNRGMPQPAATGSRQRSSSSSRPASCSSCTRLMRR